METQNYYPSNGTCGANFMEDWCDSCYKNHNCTILCGALVGKHPKQWIYGKNGQPTCTSFCKTRPSRVKKPIEHPKLF